MNQNTPTTQQPSPLPEEQGATVLPEEEAGQKHWRRLKGLMNPFPHQPGVYLMKDREGHILYVGKAKDLKKRVVSYLKVENVKTAALMEKVDQLEYIQTANEKEALILESNLIRKHRPRYNVDLRDDKRFPCLRLGLDEPFPRLQVVRRIKRDRALYFGPFSSAGKMRSTVDYLQRLFPLRQCRQKDLPRRSRPCLYFQTGRCPGPCHNKISEEEYHCRVKEVVSFLEGKNRDLLKSLKKRMTQAAEELNFEEAAGLRDRIRDISETLKDQKVVSPRFIDLDVVALIEEQQAVAAVILFIRLGSVTGLTHLRFRNSTQTREEILSDLIQQYYRGEKYIPQTILIPIPLEDHDLLEEILTELKGQNVVLRVPTRGEGRRWMAMAEENCRSILQTKGSGENFLEKTAEPLQKKLGLKKAPLSVGGLDISNIQGEQAVGSFVVFRQGKEDKNSYRRFKINTVSQPDDYAMMSEMMERLISHNPQLPDLILVDGGKGQLNILKDLTERIPEGQRPDILALAKRTFRTQGGKDGIYLPNRKNPVRLASDSPVLHFLARVRDEAHRFALAYHHKLRQKEIRTGKKNPPQNPA
ncbi:MAG: excinuclease ABC subunit UvrC [Thermodesulfobacteriota bacterium]